MNQKRMSLLVILLLSGILFLSFVHITHGFSKLGDEKEVRRMIVRLKEEPLYTSSEYGNIERVSSVMNVNNIVTKKSLKSINAQVIEADAQTIEELKKNPTVEFIEEDYQVKALGEISTWNYVKINTDVAYSNNIRGYGVKIGIVDTGIDYHHPELIQNYVDGYDFVNGDTDPLDDNGHGTHVAGIIAANDNQEGIRGIAPDSKIYSIKVLDGNGLGYVSDVIAGIEWAINSDVDIVLMSLGSPQRSLALENAIKNAYNSNILLVAAAGNDGTSALSNVNYPAAYDEVIAVGATEEGNDKAIFSSTGPEIELCAPGTNIRSTYLGNSYRIMDGTSMAAPHVAATAALLLSENSSLNSYEIRKILKDTAFDLGDNGFDNYFGYGLIDIESAMGTRNGQEEPTTNITINDDIIDYDYIKTQNMKNKEIELEVSVVDDNVTLTGVLSHSLVEYKKNDKTYYVGVIEFNSTEELHNNIKRYFEDLDKEYLTNYNGHIIHTSDKLNEWTHENLFIYVVGLDFNEMVDSSLIQEYFSKYVSDFNVKEYVNESESLEIKEIYALAYNYCDDCGAGWFNICDTSECYGLGPDCYSCPPFGVGCQFTCSSPYTCCFDGSSLGNGDGDYCKYLGQRYSGCGHNEYDCDFDSECVGSLVCDGPLGGSLDGCCYSYETWDISLRVCKPTVLTCNDCGGGWFDDNICDKEECLSIGDCYSCEFWDNCWTNINLNPARANCNHPVPYGDSDYCIYKKQQHNGCNHGEYDCDSNNECGNNLVCDGQGSLFVGDGCCYNFENWNNEQHFCNYAIKGTLYQVMTNNDGTFNENLFINSKVLFNMYDENLQYIGPSFMGLTEVDNNGDYYFNPEHHINELLGINFWNSNLFLHWTVESFVLDSNNEILGSWSNDFSSEDEDYRLGRKYSNQVVRIHLDKTYWKKTTPRITLLNLQSKEQKDYVPKINYTDSMGSLNSSFSILSQPINLISVFWNGSIRIDKTDFYIFKFSDIAGGLRVILNDNNTIDDWKDNMNQSERTFSAFLEKGEYPIRIEYYQYEDRGSPILYWKTKNSNFTYIDKGHLIKNNLQFEFYERGPNYLSEKEENFATQAISYTNDEDDYQVSFLEPPPQINTNKRPLVLVHGLHGESGYWTDTNKGNSIPDRLTNKGLDQVWKFYWPNDQKIIYSSALLRDGIDYILGNYPTFDKVDLVSHSTGGLVTLAYLENMGKTPMNIPVNYSNDIRKFIPIASPFYGSHQANSILEGSWLHQIVLWWNGDSSDEPAYKDLAVGSEFTWNLNSKELANNIDYLPIVGTGNMHLLGLFELPIEAIDSDGFVALSSASLLDKNIPVVTIDKHHGEQIGKNSLLLFPENADTSKISNLIYHFITQGTANLKNYLSSGEYYLNENDPNSDTNPFTVGGAIIKLDNPSSVNSISLNNNLFLTKNPYSNNWFYFDDNDGLGVVEGSYDIFINNVDSNEDLVIKGGHTTLLDLTNTETPLTTTITSPTDAQTLKTNSTNMTVLTNKDATCDFILWFCNAPSDCNMVEFGQMQNTGSTIHTQEILNLQSTDPNKNYRLDVSCLDAEQNEALDTNIFYVSTGCVHDADTDCNGCVSLSELFAYIRLFIRDPLGIGISNLFSAIRVFIANPLCGLLSGQSLDVVGGLSAVTGADVVVLQQGGSSVIRTLSSTNIAPNSNLDITLDVDVEGLERAYVIVEYIPSGWTVSDTGTGNLSDDGSTLTWVDVNLLGLSDVIFSYTLTAPLEEGTYNLSGIYQFESNENEQTTLGDAQIIVEEPCIPSEEVCDGLDNDCDESVDEDLIRYCSENYLGNCGIGTETCDNGEWIGCSEATLETCDATDEDCDGILDGSEGFSRWCGSTDLGACEYGNEVCDDNGNWINCDAVVPTAEICNNVDDDCDNQVDEDLNQNCGGGVCEGTKTCYLGSWSSCDSNGIDAGICGICDPDGNVVFDGGQNQDCDDGLFCNGQETCLGVGTCQAGTVIDCSSNDLLEIATCDNNPDNNPLTWDYAAGFISICDENTDSCTTGTQIIISNCNIEKCSAECINDEDCNCNNKDGCYEGTYRDYPTLDRNCVNCICEGGSCEDYVEIITDADNDTYDAECDNDCDDSNADINPSAIELCNGVDDNCNNQIDEGYTDYDGDGSADCVDEDDDNDGINDENDPLTGDSTSINSTTITPVVEINGSTNLGQSFSGVKDVVIKDNDKTIVEFQCNFSKDKINLYNVSIDKQEDNTTGSIIIKGISLPENETKTVYIDDLSTTNTLCIEDQQIASISEINSNCDGANEFSITCDIENGTTVIHDGRNYTCYDLNGTYKITGLQHSGVKEYTYVAPSSGGGPGGGGGGGGGGATERVCIESWTCTDWTPTVCPVTRQQTRTCTDRNNCGTTANKPNEIRACYYYVAPEEVEEVAEKIEEAPLAVASAEEAPPSPTPGMLAITGVAVGIAYQERPLTMALLTLFILLIVGLFIYSHARNLKHWPFHFKHPKKWLVVLVIIVLLMFIALFVHFVLLSYGGGG